VERALGEVPNVEKVYFDWRGAIAWVRFRAGSSADGDAMSDAITEKTPYSGGLVTFVYKANSLPDALR